MTAYVHRAVPARSSQRFAIRGFHPILQPQDWTMCSLLDRAQESFNSPMWHQRQQKPANMLRGTRTRPHVRRCRSHQEIGIIFELAETHGNEHAAGLAQENADSFWHERLGKKRETPLELHCLVDSEANHK